MGIAGLHWYNHEHRHSAIGFVTPAQRHMQVDQAILGDRAKVYAAARHASPNRWSGPIRNWSRISKSASIQKCKRARINQRN